MSESTPAPGTAEPQPRTSEPQTPAQILQSLGVDPAKRLSASEAGQRLEKYGPNALVEE